MGLKAMHMKKCNVNSSSVCFLTVNKLGPNIKKNYRLRKYSLYHLICYKRKNPENVSIF